MSDDAEEEMESVIMMSSEYEYGIRNTVWTASDSGKESEIRNRLQSVDMKDGGSMMSVMKRKEKTCEFLKHITVDEGFTDSMASAYSQSVSASKASNERTWRYIYI